MLEPSLKSYLENCKTQAIPFDVVNEELIKSGWNEVQISEARSWYTAETSAAAVYSSPSIKPKNNWKLVSAVACFIIILFFSGTGVFAYLINTGKITVNNEFINNSAHFIALNVPFFPKTPKIVLEKALLAHQDVTQNSMDFSMVATSNDFQSMLGLKELDLQLKGYSDVSDPHNPKFSVNGYITKDFNFDIRKKDPKVYFKINKLPILLLTFLNIDSATIDPLLANWIVYDTTPLDTEARKSLETLDKNESNDPLSEMMAKMLKEDVLPAITMSNENVDTFNTYKLEFRPAPALLDKLGDSLDDQLSAVNSAEATPLLVAANNQLAPHSTTKLSEVMKDLIITTWIDTKSYYVRKTVVSFTINPQPAPPSTSGLTLNELPVPTITESPVTVVAVVTLSDFGKTIEIVTPDTAITTDEFMQLLSEQIYGSMPAYDQVPVSSDEREIYLDPALSSSI